MTLFWNGACLILIKNFDKCFFEIAAKLYYKLQVNFLFKNATVHSEYSSHCSIMLHYSFSDWRYKCKTQKDDASELSELCNDFFKKSIQNLRAICHWGKQAYKTSMEKWYRSRSMKLAWKICMKLNLLKCTANIRKKSRALWDISNNSYFGFIFKYAETRVSRNYLFLLGTEWKNAFFRLNAQTKERQNSRLLFYLAELAISVQKCLKLKLLEELSSILITHMHT